jgi:hypothetical protein
MPTSGKTNAWADQDVEGPELFRPDGIDDRKRLEFRLDEAKRGMECDARRGG